jgi:WD40 repeat protein
VNTGEQGENPFPGLRPFEECDNLHYFGRDAHIEELLDRLGRRRFIAVVGTSGSGKSSLVRAGLLPALRGGLMAGAGSRWRIAVMRPGSSPVANLAQALDASEVFGSDGDAALRIGLARVVLERGELGLIELIGQSGVRDDESVLIVVDQFEELFRFEHDPDEAAAFVKLLLAAAAQPTLPIYVLVTMRSDFLGDSAKFLNLPETINDGLFLVPRLSRGQLRSAIEGPIGVAGARISPLLVNGLLNDLADAPDQLPVLQHALMLTWEFWSGSGASERPIDATDFAAAGGLADALSRHGDAIYESLGGPDRVVAEKLFRAITTLGSDNRGIRRPTRLSDLCAIIGASRARVSHVVETFRARDCSFLTPATGALTDDTVIDITHESLMRMWRRLAAWVEEEAQSAQQYRRLAVDADLNAVGKGALWRDPTLQFAETWRATSRPNAAWAAQVDKRLDFDRAMDFLERSVRRREAERETRLRNLWTLFGGLTFAIIILGTVATLAWQQRVEALIAQSRFLARDAAEKVDAGDAVTGMLLALEALPKDVTRIWHRPLVPDAEYALDYAVADRQERGDLRGHEQAVTSAAFSPDDRRIVSSSFDKTVRIWDVAGGAPLMTLRGHTAWVWSAAFSPDGRLIVSASGDKTVRIWDAASGAQLTILRGHEDGVTSAAFSPDGRRIVSASGDGTVRIWDANRGVLLSTLSGHREEVWSAAFSPNGRRIVSASGDKTVRVWDVARGEQVATLRGHEDTVTSATFSPDGRRIVSASLDKTARIWDATNGTLLATLRGHEDGVVSARFSPDGLRIVTASADETVRVWDAASGKPLATMRGHEDGVTSAVFSSDGRSIVSASSDKTVRIWDSASRAQLAELRGHVDEVMSAAFSPNGRRIVSASLDKTVRVWDAVSGMKVGTLRGHGGGVTFGAFSPDGRRIVSASFDKTVRIWDSTRGTLSRTLRGHQDWVWSAAFSPDGRRIVSASADKTVRIWDAASGAKLVTLRGHSDGVTAAAFSPDGRRIVSASSDKTVRLWDAQSGVQLATLRGHTDAVRSATFSPDGTRIVSASLDKTIRIWDATNGALLAILRGSEDAVRSAAFSPDGTRVVSASVDKTVRIWNVAGGAPLATLRGQDWATYAAFSPDGRRVVSSYRDATVRIWDLPRVDQRIIDAARGMLPRQLSEAQRAAEFLGR